MPVNTTVQEEILAILRDAGGIVRDDKGFAARYFYERCASASNKQVVSGSLTALDRDGKIVRDMPSAKRCTMIALPEAVKRAPRKSLRVVLGETVENLVSTMEEQVQTVIESEVQNRLHERGESDSQIEAMKSEIQGLKARNEALSIKTRPTDELEDRIRHLESTLEETREQLRIAEHNAKVWQDKALSKRWKAQEIYETIEKRLSPAELQALSKMITEVPSPR